MNQNQCLLTAGQQYLFHPGDGATPVDQFPSFPPLRAKCLLLLKVKVIKTVPPS